MRSYKSLVAWQVAHRVAMEILELTSQRGPPASWAIFDQLRRAAISVEANLVEGYALGTPALLKRHVRIAIGSAAEVECLLGLALESELIREDAATCLYKDLDRLIGLLKGLMRSSRSPTH